MRAERQNTQAVALVSSDKDTLLLDQCPTLVTSLNLITSPSPLSLDINILSIRGLTDGSWRPTFSP